ncbi:MAG: PilZ domain-containing protein [Thermodesulfovibrionales bacterium]|nr:PilZ domain-containing protein [Thermodesulfovibrionales bacterium]
MNDIRIGEEIYYRLLPDMRPYVATVASVSHNSITIKSLNEFAMAVKKGDYIFLTINDIDFYGEILEHPTKQTLKINLLWNEKREYFRINDSFPLIVKRVSQDFKCRRSRIFAGYGTKTPDDLVPDETINPVLWKMLLDIQTKLTLILERLNPDTESLLNVENKDVNISAAGICFETNERFEKDDLLEVKMLLPSHPPIGIITYGKVVRVTDTGCGQFRVAISFKDIEDEIRDEIIQYTLNRQRDMIRNQRKIREHNV